MNLSSQGDTCRFSAAASCHPAMVDKADAPGITIPFAMLPSKDEPKDDVEAWAAALKVKNIVHWWPNQVRVEHRDHGPHGLNGVLADTRLHGRPRKSEGSCCRGRLQEGVQSAAGLLP